MSLEHWFVTIIFFTMGIGLLWSAIRAKQGYNKKMAFMRPAVPGLYAQDGIFASIPIGVGLLVMSAAFLISRINFKLAQMIVAFTVITAVLMAFVLMAWKPRWLKPNWLLWLEDHYDEPTRAFMFRQAQPDKTWSQKVSTQEGLEAWAEEMAQQYRSMRGYR
jgi:hypothetical protein